MKNVSQIAKIVQKQVSDNSPTILTAVGVTGVVTTAVLAAKAGARAAEALYMDRCHRYESGQDTTQTAREKVELVWMEFAPAVGVGTVTIAAIVFSNRISTSRAAALAAAYSVTESAFESYRQKVVDRLGTEKEELVRTEIAQERIEQAKPNGIFLTEGRVLCYDLFTDRFFESTVESIKKAQNDTNYVVLNEGYASLTDFYQRIGLSGTSMSEEVGWTSDKQLEVDFTTVLSPDGKPAVAIDFKTRPARDYWKFAH